MPIVYPFYHGGIIKKVKKVNQVNLTRGIKIFCAKTKNESEIEKSSDFGRKFGRKTLIHKKLFYQISQKIRKECRKIDILSLVPLTGLEPVRILLRGILSPLCLPIPPQRHARYIITLFLQNVNVFLQITSC